jgi:hypothetical protein
MIVRPVHTHFMIMALAIGAISGYSFSTQQENISTATVSLINATQVPLYTEFQAERSVGPNGKQIDASLAGKDYPNSTGMWVGCSGQAATTTYHLSHKYNRLQATAGLQPHTPEQLNVNVTITGDNRTLQQFALTKQNPVPVDVNLSGVDSLVVAAIAVNNQLCGSSGTPYGALGNAELTEG